MKAETKAAEHVRMGIRLQTQGRLDEAFSCYQKALELNPDCAEAFNNIGNVFKERGKVDQALALYHKSVRMKPSFAEGHGNIGSILNDQGRFAEAIPYYQKAIKLKPELDQAVNTLVFLLKHTCAWQELEHAEKQLDDLTHRALESGMKTAESPFVSLMRHPDPVRNIAVARLHASDIATRASDADIRFSFDNRGTAKKKLIIGYLSYDFRDHPVGHQMVSLFGCHHRDEFEAFCYSHGEDDGSYYRRRIKTDCDRFIDIRRISDEDAARRIHEDQVDILVDLTGYMKGNRLAICALRPAPVQVSYLGFPGSTGASWFDYIITDRIVTPEEHAAFYSEKFVYMPHGYMVSDHAGIVSHKAWSRPDVGLPEEGIVFCSFNQGYKIEAVLFDIWMRILRQIPGSLLWLMKNEAAAENLRQAARARHVNPGRLLFAERLPAKADHLARVNLADLALDTRIYNGHATTNDMLRAGVPVITLQGAHFASRTSSSFLASMGLSELITHSIEEYENLAIRLATHPDELQATREKLEKNRLTGPLFDTPRFVRNLEIAYQEMWKLFLSGEGPRPIKVTEPPGMRVGRPSPENAWGFYHMGIELRKQGRSDEAMTCFQKAVEMKPNFPDAYIHMGNIVQAQNRSDEAISYYEHALRLDPDSAMAWNNMGNLIRRQGRLNEASRHYHQAIRLNPDFAGAYNNLGTVCLCQGKPDEAISHYRNALRLQPEMTRICPNLLLQLQQVCDWREMAPLAEKVDALTRAALDKGMKPDEMPFVNIIRHADPRLNFAVARSYASDIAKRASELKIRFSHKRRKPRMSRIRIGYLSNDFCHHATAHLMLSLFGLHHRDEFEVCGYSYGKDDGSLYRKRIKGDCDRFVDLHGLSHGDAAAAIYEDQVDILVDLKGHTTGSRLDICALRPAPVQVTWLGFPGTTGADFFDHIITDRIVTPRGHARWYSEKLLFMPHCYQVNDHAQPISEKEWKRADFGLPDKGFLFCSFTTAYKIEPGVFDVWMRMLHHIPGSVLWLLSRNASMERNLRREAESRGVSPDRLIFSGELPKDQHLARCRLADLALDTWIVNGHTSTSDALWAGVPVITLQGTHFASRVSASILRSVGLPDLITQTPDEYEDLGVWLAESAEELQGIRRRLAKNRLTQPLFDTPRFVKNLERAYKVACDFRQSRS